MSDAVRLIESDSVDFLLRKVNGQKLSRSRGHSRFETWMGKPRAAVPSVELGILIFYEVDLCFA